MTDTVPFWPETSEQVETICTVTSAALAEIGLADVYTPVVTANGAVWVTPEPRDEYDDEMCERAVALGWQAAEAAS